MPRLFIDAPLRLGSPVQLPVAAVRHVQALRLRHGEPVVLFNGQGGETVADLILEGRNAAALPREHVPADRTLPHAITLAQALLSSEKMDLVVQKATELGVARIMPFASARSTSKLDADRAAKRLQHWQAVACAACEQCGMNRLPRIDPVAPLGEVVQAAVVQGAGRISLAIGAQQPIWALPRPQPDQGTMIAIGPEGDFTNEELALLDGAGFIRVSLGQRVLRTETAGLAAIAMLTAAWQLA
jgi:16S rRNA (uracil1498-N3)-methyltransferase